MQRVDVLLSPFSVLVIDQDRSNPFLWDIIIIMYISYVLSLPMGKSIFSAP